MKILFALLAACALFAVVAQADAPIYKWVDAQGKVHYGPQPQSDTSQQLSITNKGQGVPAGGTRSAPPAATGRVAPAAMRPQVR